MQLLLWWKSNNIIHSECGCVFVALGIQHAMRMHCTILLSVACLALPCFAQYLIRGTTFGKRDIGHEMCVLISSKNSVRKYSHSKKKLARCGHKCRLVFM